MALLFPFSAIVGQDELRLALELAVVDPGVGGVLVLGDRGTGKSTAVRALAGLLPKMKVAEGCPYHCDPRVENASCPSCSQVPAGSRRSIEVSVPVVDLPLGATEDRVVGALDLEAALTRGERAFSPGLLARANRGFLYIDEVNLLPDHVVDVLLDVAASGENVVEREGLSVRHPARFVLIGSGNPEEGELRPQLLDRFGLSLDVKTPGDLPTRVEVVKRRTAFEQSPATFLQNWAPQEAAITARLEAGRGRLREVVVPDAAIERAATLCQALGTDGLRGELTLVRAARALAALTGDLEVADRHLLKVAPLALRHRLRRNPLDEVGSTARVEKALSEVFPRVSAVDGDARWHDAVTAVEVLSVDAAGVGGVLMRAWPGPVRDQLCEALKQVVAGPVLRLPIHVTEDRLLGGLSLAATLQAGRVVVERGVLSQANGGVVLVSMAERLDPTVAAHLCAALDQRQLSLERDGVAQVLECRIGLVALDEGLDDEGTTPSLADRLGLHLDLRELSARGLPAVRPDAARVLAARERFPATKVPDEVVTALCEAAEQLGVPSLRAPVLAAAVARAHAALHGRPEAGEEDAVFAARLVLGPRATRLPPAEPEIEAEAPPEPEPPSDDAQQPPPPPPEAQDDAPPNEDDSPPSEAMLQELLSAAAQSALPQGVLELLAAGRGSSKGPRSAGRAGTLRASNAGGRPAGTRAAVPQPGDRLNLVETLRAAAPWQRLRRKANGTAKVVVTLDDLRITRFVQRSESVVIFCVDASGSAALQRLAEAKGAVEQVLGDCYVRRDHVALIAFRGEQASLLLPPTRSLVRVRRCLADLAGGGGTPLAAGIDAALELALDGRKRGRTPLVVLMTDGRGNVGHAGARGAAAQADATASARRLRAQGVRALFLDTSPRPRAQARALAVEMAATYLPLPHLNARVISTQVQSMTERRG